jgi:hypothetical protein
VLKRLYATESMIMQMDVRLVDALTLGMLSAQRLTVFLIAGIGARTTD